MVADRDDRAQQVGQPCGRRIPDDTRTPRREIDARLRDTGLAREPRLDQPDACATVNAFEQQRHFLSAVVRRAHEPRLRRRLVPVRPFVPRFEFGLRPVGGDGAARVERIETGGMDRSCDAETTRTAEALRDAIEFASPARRLGIGIAAVEAAGGARLSRCRRRTAGGRRRARHGIRGDIRGRHPSESTARAPSGQPEWRPARRVRHCR